MRFDLLILGDTPEAWVAAEVAALHGRRTAVLRPDRDGCGVESGLAAVLACYGEAAYFTPSVTSASPRELCLDALKRREAAIRRLGRELNVRYWHGPVRLTGPTSAEVVVDDVDLTIEAHQIVIAVGTTFLPPKGLSIDRRTIFTPEDVPNMTSTPERLIVLGGNPTARAFARLFIAAGSDVTLIDRQGDDPDGFAGMIVGEVHDLQRTDRSATVRLADGREFAANAILFAAGGRGATDSLGLGAAGLEADDVGRLWCDEEGRTWVATIAALGESVGFPPQLKRMAAIPRMIGMFAEPPGTNSYEPQMLAVA